MGEAEWQFIRDNAVNISLNGDVKPYVEAVDSVAGGAWTDGGLLMPVFIVGCVCGIVVSLLRRATGSPQ